MQPMLRSGSVRAFSHLPQPVRANPKSPAGPRPFAPANAPSWSTAPEAGPGHVSESEAGTDDGRQAALSLHKPEDGRPWYLPSISSKDLPQDFDEDQPDSGLNRPTSEPWEDSDLDNGGSPAPQPPRDSFTPSAPDAPTIGEAPVQSNRPALSRDRLFERRQPPGLRDQGAGQPRSPTDQAQFHDLGYRTQGKTSSPMQFQAVAAAGKAPGKDKIPLVGPDTSGDGEDPLAPSTPKQDQSGKNDTKNLSPPKQQKQTPAPPPPAQEVKPTAPAAGGSQTGRSNMTVDDDKNSPFSAAVRAAMDREMKDSPSSTTLLNAAKGLPNKIKIVPKIAGEANTTLQADGTIVISVNTRNMTSATMSHELANAVQQAVYYNTLKELAKYGADPKKKETIDKAVQAGRDALNGVLPLQNKNDQGQEFKENEAMRAGHIVNAERTAAEIKTKISDGASMSPEKIAEMFWKEQLKKEDSKHMNNGLIIPKGTKYGDYDFAPVLKSLGHGVTLEQLKNARKKLIENGW